MQALWHALRCSRVDENTILVPSQKRRKVRVTGNARNESRASDFIGVSRNGRKWQALIMEGPIKRYLCLVDEQEEAALSYDKHALVLHGLHGKTNFAYTRAQILALFYEDFLTYGVF